MTKYHISKNGKPSICKATKGNCPLGGADGNENHFDSKEAAQAFADQTNEKEYGLIPDSQNSVTSVQIDEEEFDYAFPEATDVHGYALTGVHKVTMEEDGEHEELYESLPDDIKEKENFTLVPEYNIKDHLEQHIFTEYPEEYEPENYAEMVETAEAHNPDLADFDELDSDFQNKVIAFAENKLKNESTLEINGKKMFVEEYEPRNWVKEYLDSQK